MKRLLLTSFFAIVHLKAWSAPDCGTDWNCFYEHDARVMKQEEDQEREREEAFRDKQLQLQEEQLIEIEQQNSLLEEQAKTLENLEEKLKDLNKKKEIEKPAVSR